MIMKVKTLAVVIDKMPHAPLSKLLKALIAEVAHALGRPRLFNLKAFSKL